MKNLKVVKRNKEEVDFDSTKISSAIKKAAKERLTNDQIAEVVVGVLQKIGKKNRIGIEKIQDFVETSLMEHGHYDIAKDYILYRQEHSDLRAATKKLSEVYKNIFYSDAKEADFRRDNANINTDAPMGIMLKMGTESSKFFVDNYVLDEDTLKADREGYLHIHDKDFSLATFNCCQIDLIKLFEGGFSTGHGFLREPSSIRSAASLACIAIQSNQNDMFGGQSIAAFDYAMAKYVKKSFLKHYRKEIEKQIYNVVAGNGMPISNMENIRDMMKENALLSSYENFKEEDIASIYELVKTRGLWIPHLQIKKIVVVSWEFASRDTEEETHQAMEALIHNFNTLHSRAGAQVPFSSINYGTDTSPEGRLVIKEVLTAIDNGLGNGETPIFPISVFTLGKGYNYDPEDPNYDLFKYACKVSAKRLFPNFNNMDAPFNKQYFKEGDYRTIPATMGCRTRVISNVNGPEIYTGRGNFAFVTLNLPMYALEARENARKLGDPNNPELILREFWNTMDKYIKISHDYLLSRYENIAKKHVYNFPFLMGQHVWIDSDKLKPTDEIRDVLKHSSLSIGFCGLAECLVALIGEHHGESEKAQELGLRIVGHLRKCTDYFTDHETLNWTCFATPAESTAGTFLRACRKKFGVVPGVTEHEYLTNSSHVPVYYKIKAIDKIRIEAPYHSMENAGHIAYVEMDGDPSKNVKAFEDIVRAMHDADMGYFSINHPVDRDPVCGYTGVIENECPHCHRREDGHYEEIMNKL